MLIPWQGTSQLISAGCNTSGKFTLLLPLAVVQLINAFQKNTVRLKFLSNRYTMNHRVSRVGRVTTFISWSLLLKFKTVFDTKLFLELKLIPHRECGIWSTETLSFGLAHPSQRTNILSIIYTNNYLISKCLTCKVCYFCLILTKVKMH